MGGRCLAGVSLKTDKEGWVEQARGKAREKGRGAGRRRGEERKSGGGAGDGGGEKKRMGKGGRMKTGCEKGEEGEDERTNERANERTSERTSERTNEKWVLARAATSEEATKILIKN